MMFRQNVNLAQHEILLLEERIKRLENFGELNVAVKNLFVDAKDSTQLKPHAESKLISTNSITNQMQIL